MRPNLTAEERGYVAGIVDGEGWIGYRVTPPCHADGSLGVTSTTRELLDWLCDRLGGHIGEPHQVVPHQKQYWTWLLSGRYAAALCAEIGPLLVIKKEQAALLVEAFTFLRASRWRPLTKEQASRRWEIAAAFRKLNRRGVELLEVEKAT